MTHLGQVFPVLAMIGSTLVAKIPPEIKPDLGRQFTGSFFHKSQESKWHPENTSNWDLETDHPFDEICEFQIVPLRKMGQLNS